MKKISMAMLASACLIISSCEDKSVDYTPEISNEIPESVIKKLQDAGFDTSEGLYKTDNGYVVEHDIFLTEENFKDLVIISNDQKITDQNGRGVEPDVLFPKHYRTTNIVGGMPRVINVFMHPDFNQHMQNSLNIALGRYNDLSYSSIRFQRTNQAALANISIIPITNVNYYARASWPSNGEPGSTIWVNTGIYTSTNSLANAATVIAHEIGHTIGFRHTDYMNRSFSCESGGAESNVDSDGTLIGAHHIAGTPTEPSADSWMLACIDYNVNRPFTREDATAIGVVYPAATPVQRRERLNGGERLNHGQFLQSADGRYRLMMQADGNLVLSNSDKAYWSSRTSGNSQIAYCIMQGDGNLVLYDNNGKAYWSSGTYGRPGAYLVMQSDGNLVIYHNGVAIWATGRIDRY